jgi:hypothetical protein
VAVWLLSHCLRVWFRLPILSTGAELAGESTIDDKRKQRLYVFKECVANFTKTSKREKVSV